MKKIVRRNHIRENFRANLTSLNEAIPLAAIAGGAAVSALTDIGIKYGPKVMNSIGKLFKGKGKGKPKPKGKGDAAGAAAGAGAAGMIGGFMGGSQASDIYGKDRPQTGFRDRYQGIDPFRSGEMRASAGYYDTPVGRRQLYKGAGGGLVAPPSTMYENTVFPQLQEMVNKSIKTKEINNILVTQDMAKNIVELYEALNTKNKRILEESVQSKDGFFEVLDFSVRN